VLALGQGSGLGLNANGLHPRCVREGHRDSRDQMPIVLLILRLRTLVGHGDNPGHM